MSSSICVYWLLRFTHSGCAGTDACVAPSFALAAALSWVCALPAAVANITTPTSTHAKSRRRIRIILFILIFLRRSLSLQARVPDGLSEALEQVFHLSALPAAHWGRRIPVCLPFAERLQCRRDCHRRPHLLPPGSSAPSAAVTPPAGHTGTPRFHNSFAGSL